LNNANALIVAEYRDPANPKGTPPVTLLWLTQTGIEFELHLANNLDPEDWDSTLIENEDWNQLGLKTILENQFPEAQHPNITLFI